MFGGSLVWGLPLRIHVGSKEHKQEEVRVGKGICNALCPAYGGRAPTIHSNPVAVAHKELQFVVLHPKTYRERHHIAILTRVFEIEGYGCYIERRCRLILG